VGKVLANYVLILHADLILVKKMLTHPRFRAFDILPGQG
jgi:hypothetical protein